MPVSLLWVKLSVCVCVCARACVFVCIMRITKLELLQQGQKKGYLLTGNPKLFHWRERKTNKKKEIVQWDLHVYVVCECMRYLGIVAAE